MKKLEVGTLIKDNDKIGVITKVIEVGTLDTDIDIINWRANYEVHYVDGIISILGCKTIDRLTEEGKIEIIFEPTTPLPPSSSKDILRECLDLHDKDEINKKDRRDKCGQKQKKRDQ
jgi:hypothetical protein